MILAELARGVAQAFEYRSYRNVRLLPALLGAREPDLGHA